MKTCITKSFALSMLAAGLNSVLAGLVRAQAFTTLYSFTGASSVPPTNSDGASPTSRLILSDGTLYGTAAFGGSSGLGTIFKVNTDGSGFNTIHIFGGSDGRVPYAGLIISSNILYGTTYDGGNFGAGNVFRVQTDGTRFASLHSFTGGGEGCCPIDGLVLSSNVLYGTTYSGGTPNSGTLFKVTTDGTGFKNLHVFSGGSDGRSPRGPLVLSGNTLYGTAAYGGSSSNGTVFAVNTDGTRFTIVHSFTGGDDGGGPGTGLILSGDTLYGTAGYGGSSGNGTVFAVNTDGTGFRNLHSFAGDSSEGQEPTAALILSGNTLYGTADAGGSSGYGTVFAVNTDGTGFVTVYRFNDASAYTNNNPINSDGANPEGGLIVAGATLPATLHGTARYGGSSGNGTVFSILVPPQLTIARSSTNIILTWPTNAIGFSLQSTANIGPSAVWSTNSPGPVVVNGHNTVTNPISGTKQFFRVSQ